MNKNIIFSIVFLCLFVAPNLVYAEEDKQDKDKSGVSQLENPLKQNLGEGTILNIGRGVLETGLGVLGSLTLLVFVIGGVMWLTSGGNEQRVEKGTKTMLYAAIGILVIFSSYAIISTLIKVITGS